MNVGSTNTTSATTVQAGTGGLNITTQGTGALNVGNNAVAQTINIGNTTGATALNLQAGTGNFSLNGVAATTYDLAAATTTGTIALGGTAQTGTMTLGRSTATNTISIGGAAGNGNTQTINIGNSGTAGSTTNVTIGSTIAGLTTLQSAGGVAITTLGTADSATYLCRNTSNIISTCNTTGAGAAFVQGGNTFAATAVLGTNDSNSLTFETNNVTQATIAVGGATTFQNSINSAAGFQVLESGATKVLTVDTTNQKVAIGNNTAANVGAGGLEVTGTIATAGNFRFTSTTTNSGAFNKYTIAGTTGADQNDVLVLDASGYTASTTTTARNPRVYGINASSGTTASGGTMNVVVFGNTTVNADAGGGGASAIAIGDQLVTSTTTGRVIKDNNATTGIIGRALTALASGTGTVSIFVTVDAGQDSPIFRNQADSSTAFQIQQADGSARLTVDTGSQQGLKIYGDTGDELIELSGAAGLQVRTTGTSAWTNLGTNADGTNILNLYNSGATTVASVSGTGAVTLVNSTNSATAFQIQNAAGTNELFSVDTSNNRVYVGDTTGDTIGTILVLDTKTDGTDPTGVNGGMYYNSNLNKFRCYENSAWGDCLDGFTSLQDAYNNDTDGSDSVISLTADDDSLIFRNPSSGGTNGTGYVVTIDQLATGAVGGLDIQSAGTGNLLRVRDTTATATDVLTIADGGAATFRNQTNSTAAFQVQNAAGASLFNIDSTNAGNITVLGNNGGEVGSWTTNSNNLPSGYNQGSVTYANGYAYIVGGDTGSLTTSVLYARVNANGSLGSFTSTTALSVAREDISTVAMNGYLYAIGGNSTDDTATTGVTTANYAKINSDGTIGSWNTTTALPTGRSTSGTVAYNGYIYLVAGSDTSSAIGSTVYAKQNADGTLGSWTVSGNVFPTAKVARATRAVAANGYLYAIGGQEGASPDETEVFYARLNSDGTIGTWTEEADLLPSGRAWGGAGVANGYLYYWGGTDGTSSQDEVFYAQLNSDGSTGAWATNTTLMTTTESDIGFFTTNGYLYALGMGASDNEVHYVSTPRVTIGGGLDLVGLSGENLAEGGTGGTLTAGNTQIIGTLGVQGVASFRSNLSVDGMVTLRNANNSTSALSVQNAAGTSLLDVDTTNGRVNIGTYGTETAQLYVSGSTPSVALTTLSGGSLSLGGDDIDVVGNYAYVASYDESDLDIIDISNPASPTVVSSTDFSALGTSPEAITVSGGYAYLAMSATDQVAVVNVTNPAVPTAVTSVSTNDYPLWLEARGNYLYVVNDGASGDSLQIFDISNPASPRLLGTASSLNSPRKAYIEGNYVYLAAAANLRVVDVSNPASPVTYTETLQTGLAGLAIAKYGKYVYVSDTDDDINVLDVSNPADPVDVTTFFSDADIEELHVQGRFMYGVSNQGATSKLMTYDLSNPAAPVALNSVTTGNSPYHLAVNGRYAYVPIYNNDQFQVFDIGGAYIQQLEAGGIKASTIDTQDANVRNNAYVGGSLNVGRTVQINGTLGVGGTATFNGDIQFGGDANRMVQVLQNTSAGAGRGLTVKAGQGNAGAGGVLTVSGGDGQGTNQNGGNVIIQGGTGTGSGVQGLVNLSTSAFTSASTQAFGSNGSLTAGLVDQYSTIPVNATAASLTVTIPAPAAANQVVGRLLYIAAVDNSNDFTISLAGTSITIVMKENSTATLIWNGTGWTAAGASSSTDLQSAYNNTISSAGGAELVLNAPGGAADGLTIRNNATTPIIGSILEAQTSIGSNLFSVNNNAAEFATNGGAETAGGSASTFPSNTWDTTTGGTVDRWTTTGDNVATGQASVRVQTTTTNHGARNRISTSLTSGLTYSVSVAVRGAANFTTLQVLYSPDGTTSGTTTCATGQTVTSGIWTRIACTFVASGTITSSNSMLIRQTDATARTFYVDNLSVNINASATYAADGSVDNAGAFGTNWTAFDGDGGGAGTATAARDTTVLYDSSGSARVDTSNHANMGIRNNLAITPAVSTQYLVSFYGRTATGSITDLTVRYSRDGGTDLESCVDYNTQTLVTTGWTKITCLFTTDSSAPSNADLIFTQNAAPGGTRSIYIDALTVTLNTNNANNVQIGGANKGGPTTLFTLDRASTAPIAANNDAYLGSMYYDTTTGRIQCYEADGWGACGSAPDNIANLNPEFAGAVLNGTGVGTMTADFCGNGGGLSVNTGLCASGEARNYYQWTSPQATQQTYSIYVTYQLPATFKEFASDDTVQLTARTDNTTNGVVTYQMYRSESGSISACGTETTVTSTINTWQTVGINGNEATGCGFTTNSANAFVIFKINVKANSNANVYVGTLSFTTTGR